MADYSSYTSFNVLTPEAQLVEELNTFSGALCMLLQRKVELIPVPLPPEPPTPPEPPEPSPLDNFEYSVLPGVDQSGNYVYQLCAIGNNARTTLSTNLEWGSENYGKLIYTPLEV